jgi:DNA-binding NarL/FixJ family response regulator
MPGKDGLTVLRELHAEQLPTRVVMLTAALDADDAVEAVRLGVKGLVLKDMAPDLLVQCIREVAAGGQGFDRGAITKAMEKLLRRETMAEATASLLSARELEIARMVATGRSNKEIARELGIAEATIKTHLYNVYQKVGVANRVGLTLWAQERQLV